MCLLRELSKVCMNYLLTLLFAGFNLEAMM